jgi:N-acylneuraminate cytidylyltransferase
MKNVVIIPARGGSKRLPNKNVMLFGEIPLLAHSILYAQKNHAIVDEIYVSTNNAAIKEVALSYGAKVIDRPDDLSGDYEPTITAIEHGLKSISPAVANVIILQPTNPLRPENMLKEAYEYYENNNCDSLFTVTRNHQKLGRIEHKSFIPYNYEVGQRSQDLEPLYFENGLLYITKAKAILEHKIITENAFPFEVNHIFATVDIDNQGDLDYAAFLFKNHNS